jgi:hypothetical protein
MGPVPVGRDPSPAWGPSRTPAPGDRESQRPTRARMGTHHYLSRRFRLSLLDRVATTQDGPLARRRDPEHCLATDRPS